MRQPTALWGWGGFCSGVILALALGQSSLVAAETELSAAERDREAVAKRAEARWRALIKGNLSDAYDYLSPGIRATLPLEMYAQKVQPGLWKDVRVQEVACEVERCSVTVQITYDFRDMKGIETPINEVWIREGAEWYYARKM
jgi:hypothetical protein